MAGLPGSSWRAPGPWALTDQILSPEPDCPLAGQITQKTVQRPGLSSVVLFLGWSDQPPLLGLQGRPAHSLDLIKLFPQDGSVVLELRLPAPSVLLPPPFDSEKNTVNRQRHQEYGCLVFDSVQGNLLIFLHFLFVFH